MRGLKLAVCGLALMGASTLRAAECPGNPDAIAARTKEYEEKFLNPFVAAARGWVDEVIRPHNTRRRVAGALRMLRNKQVPHIWKKHDNIPL